METEQRLVQELVFRVRAPLTAAALSPVVLLLHGWTGDESSMWVFASRLPRQSLLLAPRAPFPSPLGGYSWHAQQHLKWPWVDDFNPALELLMAALNGKNFPNADFESFDVVGFSQGAALGIALALQSPARVRRLAGLSGFLPEGAQALARYRPLANKSVFLAHGSQDKLVPVEKARLAAQTLEEAGARVTYCEDEVGHKLSSGCYRALEEFFRHTAGGLSPQEAMG